MMSNAAARGARDKLLQMASPFRMLLFALQRAQHVFNRLWRPLTIGVRAIVIDAENRVFLVRHSYLPGWHLPGGGVEPGETVRAALERELAEEGNIELTGEPSLLCVYFNNYASERDHVLIYIVRDFRQTAPRERDWEIVETGFFPADALPEQSARATRARIAEALEGGRTADIW